MVLDYKGVSFSFKNQKIRRRRQKLKLALLILLIVAAICAYRFLQVNAAIVKIESLLLNNRVEAAAEKLADLQSSFWGRGNIRELLALSDLFQDRLPQAEARFAKLGRDKIATSLHSGQFQKYFVDHGEFAKLKIYTDYLLPQGGDENIWFYALYQTAFLDYGESEKAIARLSTSFRKNNAKAMILLAKVNANLLSGRFDYVFDKNDRLLAYFDIKSQSTHSLIPGFDFTDFNLQIKQNLGYFRLTLDAGLQKKVDNLFNNFFGTLVLLELPENSIVVAYSKPRFPEAGNEVFSKAYEPGSIIKIISLLAYLRHSEQNLFPFNCPGQLIIGGRVFYDWIAHNQVKDYSEALAFSCNLSFARMGLEVGFRDLASLLERFYLNTRPFSDRFMKFQTGSFNRNMRDDLELANLAVGLGNVSLTTVHAAVLAAVFSQNGLLFSPYIIDNARSILDLGVYVHNSRPIRVLADDLSFIRIKKAMQEVVENVKGTGRRAWSPAVELAIKTGTAGDRKRGLDAIVMGFFPAEQPRYAFAFRLEGAGKAELNGAFFLRDLLQALYK